MCLACRVPDFARAQHTIDISKPPPSPTATRSLCRHRAREPDVHDSSPNRGKGEYACVEHPMLAVGHRDSPPCCNAATTCSPHPDTRGTKQRSGRNAEASRVCARIPQDDITTQARAQGAARLAIATITSVARLVDDEAPDAVLGTAEPRPCGTHKALLWTQSRAVRTILRAHHGPHQHPAACAEMRNTRLVCFSDLADGSVATSPCHSKVRPFFHPRDARSSASGYHPAVFEI